MRAWGHVTLYIWRHCIYNKSSLYTGHQIAPPLQNSTFSLQKSHTHVKQTTAFLQIACLYIHPSAPFLDDWVSTWYNLCNLWRFNHKYFDLNCYFCPRSRLRHLRGNIKDLKDRATVQKQSLVKFIGKKLKKPNVPKPDYALDSETICEEDSDALATSMANKPRQMSTFSTGSHSDSQSDIHSISSHHSSVNLHHSSSSLHHSNSAASADQLPHAFTPRPKASTSSSADVRQKTKSLGALLVPPPLPPRNTRSQYL